MLLKMRAPCFVIPIFILAFFPFDLSTAIIFIRVDQSGNGNYTTVQAAINSVPPNNSNRIVIFVTPGIYKEKIVIPPNKPFITIIGTKAVETVITWDDSHDIFESPTLSVLASDFRARYITIQNSYGAGARAVALRVSGDRAVFIGCKILSHQDTLLDDKGRHYYLDCYIEGDTDFIFGNGASLFESCHLHSLALGTGTITAQRRQSTLENTGFVFLKCKITGLKSTLLGRPWGAYSRVVFVYTYMSDVVSPQGWDDWGDPSKQRTSYYGEYECYGPGAKTSKRVKWSRNLSRKEVVPFLAKGFWIRSFLSHLRRRISHGVHGKLDD